MSKDTKKAAATKAAPKKSTTKAAAPAVKKATGFKYTATFDDNPKRKGSKVHAVFAALKKVGKDATAEKILKKIPADSGVTMYDVTDTLYYAEKAGHCTRVALG